MKGFGFEFEFECRSAEAVLGTGSLMTWSEILRNGQKMWQLFILNLEPVSKVSTPSYTCKEGLRVYNFTRWGLSTDETNDTLNIFKSISKSRSQNLTTQLIGRACLIRKTLQYRHSLKVQNDEHHHKCSLQRA